MDDVDFPFEVFEPGASSLFRSLYILCHGPISLWRKNIMVQGPAGCGKKSLIRAITSKLNLRIMEVDVQDPEIEKKLSNTGEKIILLTDILNCFALKEPKLERDLTLRKLVEGNSCVIFVSSMSEPLLELSLMFDLRVSFPQCIRKVDIPKVLEYIFHPIKPPPGGLFPEVLERVSQLTWKEIHLLKFELVKKAVLRGCNLEQIWEILVQGELNHMAHKNIPEIASVEWTDIVGLEHQKRLLQIFFPKEGIKKTITPEIKGILLHGPPGTGKTMIAKAISSTKKYKFIPVSLSEWIHAEIGESQKAIKATFLEAKKCSPSVLFVDEIDSLFGIPCKEESKGYVTESILNQLKEELDNLNVEETPVLFLAATNNLQNIPPEILKPKRIDKLIHIPPPVLKDIVNFLKKAKLEKRISSSIDEEHLAQHLEGLTVPDMSCIIRKAFLRAQDRNNRLPDSQEIIETLNESKINRISCDVVP